MSIRLVSTVLSIDSWNKSSNNVTTVMIVVKKNVLNVFLKDWIVLWLPILIQFLGLTYNNVYTSLISHVLGTVNAVRDRV